MTVTNSTLVLVGAALGTGRWLAEHLLPHRAWDDVVLVDSDATKTSLSSLDWGFSGRVRFASSTVQDGRTALVEESTREPIELPGGRTSLWVAVPPAATADVVADLAPLCDRLESIFVVAPRLAELLEQVTPRVSAPTYGLHPLFDSSMPSLAGQIVYVTPATSEAVPDWLEAALVHGGGILKVGTAAHHDAVMGEVQARTHRVLVDFAEAITTSGLELETDLWESRTPLFETLFGLAVRVLDSRETVIAPEELERVRQRFSGALYDTVRGSAVAAITAAQAKRLALAAQWRAGALVALRRNDDGSVRVGRIAELTSTSLVLEELLVGPPGRAALLDGPGELNAKRLGVALKRRRIPFSLGHLDLMSGDELEAFLNENLAFLSRDLRFLVPESVAGAGVLRVIESTPGLRECELVDEVVRIGQRSVVIRVAIRADLDLNRVAEDLQRTVAAAYQWPAGLALALTDAASRIVYLGPTGTFSEDAAGQCAGSVGAPEVERVALGSFDEVLAAVSGGSLGVLPVTSSASGLVSRAVQALLDHDRPIVAGGMVDVAVRFDAYVRPGSAHDLRGATVFSHPQGLAQCGAFIRRWGLVPQPCDSTAAALLSAVNAEGPAVALAGVGKGADLGLEVLEREVDDIAGSITRFLVLGAPEVWGDFAGGSRPTLRHLWVGNRLGEPGVSVHLGNPGTAGFDELLTDADGRWLLITSRDGAAGPPEAARLLGSVPWSPRTPVVRAGAGA